MLKFSRYTTMTPCFHAISPMARHTTQEMLPSDTKWHLCVRPKHNRHSDGTQFIYCITSNQFTLHSWFVMHACVCTYMHITDKLWWMGTSRHIPEVQCAFSSQLVPGILQFTVLITCRCNLHCWANQGIHRWKISDRSKTRNNNQLIHHHIHETHYLYTGNESYQWHTWPGGKDMQQYTPHHLWSEREHTNSPNTHHMHT